MKRALVVVAILAVALPMQASAASEVIFDYIQKPLPGNVVRYSTSRSESPRRATKSSSVSTASSRSTTRRSSSPPGPAGLGPAGPR